MCAAEFVVLSAIATGAWLDVRDYVVAWLRRVVCRQI